MTGLLKCSCGQFVTENKEQVRIHERSFHAYGHVEWHKVRHVLLTKEEKDKIAVKGETRLGAYHFFGHEAGRISVSKPEIDVPEIKYYHGPNEPVK